MHTDLKPFIPSVLQCERTTYPCNIESEQNAYVITYTTKVANKYAADCGTKTYVFRLPKSILLDTSSLEVIGLLQGEMSKTYRRSLTFTNSEPEIMNRVLRWFRDQFDIGCGEWKWYIRLNIQNRKKKLS